jgi:hypothetical protein
VRERALARRGSVHVRRVALVAVLLLASCSRGRPAGVMVQSTGSYSSPEYEELIALDQQVDMLSGQQDCAGGCEAGARLCELSERICDIASRDHDPEVQGRCVDGRERCERARERLAFCACGP